MIGTTEHEVIDGTEAGPGWGSTGSQPPGLELPSGSQWFFSPSDSQWYIKYPNGDIEVRDWTGRTSYSEVQTPSGPIRMRPSRPVGDGQQVLTRPTAPNSPEVIAQQPGQGSGAQEVTANSGAPIVLPVVSAAVIVALIIDGLNQYADKLDRCAAALPRVVSALFDLKTKMAALLAAYQAQSARLDVAIASCTGRVTNQADAVYLSSCRTNMDAALAEIQRRVQLAEWTYTPWQGWDCANTLVTPGGVEYRGPSSSGVSDVNNIVSLYNDGCLTLGTWVSAIDYAENVAAKYPPV